MALPSSGPLTLTDIQTEFGGSNPIGLDEYYAGGANVPAGTSGTYGAVPSSGAISIQNFYGTAKVTSVKYFTGPANMGEGISMNAYSTNNIASMTLTAQPNAPYAQSLTDPYVIVERNGVYYQNLYNTNITSVYYIASSTDRVNWVLRAVPTPSGVTGTNQGWKGPFSTTNYLVMCGERGAIRSTDGINWVQSYPNDGQLTNITFWGYLASADRILGIRSTAGTGYPGKSLNGNADTVTFGTYMNYTSDIACTPTALYTTRFRTTTDRGIYISTDGITWSLIGAISVGTSRVNFFTNNKNPNLNGRLYFGSYTATTSSPTNYVALTGTAPRANSICWSASDGKWYGLTATQVVQSTDGVNWTATGATINISDSTNAGLFVTS